MTTPTPRPVPTLADNSLRARLSALGVRPASQRLTDQPLLLVGSRRDCDLYINHAEVSKVHAAIVNTGGSLVVVDLSSRGGTYVNGQRVAVATLKRGDRLAAACVDIQVDWLAVAADAAAALPDETLTLEPPLVLAGEGAEFVLRQAPAVIGRRQSSAIQLDTPDVSLAHALIFLIAGRPVVADLESRSGTYVNRDAVRLSFLCEGDELTIGGVRLHVTGGGTGTNLDSGPAVAHATPVASPPERVAAQPAPQLTVRAAAPPPQTGEANDAELEDTIRELRDYLDRIESQLRVRRRQIAERESHLETRCAAVDSQRRDLEAGSTELALRLADVENREQNLRRGEETIADASRRLEQFRSALFETGRSLGVKPRASA